MHSTIPKGGAVDNASSSKHNFQVPKNIHAVALSKLGAKKGGLARARSLSPERRKEIAVNAARARWDRSTIAAPQLGETE